MTPCDVAVAPIILCATSTSRSRETSPPAYTSTRPSPSPSPASSREKLTPLERVTFGNVFREGFETIWQSEAYIRFQEVLCKEEERFRDFEAL
jgi:hypothetical protein